MGHHRRCRVKSKGAKRNEEYREEMSDKIANGSAQIIEDIRIVHTDIKVHNGNVRYTISVGYSDSRSSYRPFCL